MLTGTVARVLARAGTLYTLRTVTRAAGANSWTAGSETLTYDVVRAFETSPKPAEIRETGMNADEKLIIVDAATVTTPPVRGSRIALGEFASDAGGAWAEVVHVHAAREAGAVRVYRLRVKA